MSSIRIDSPQDPDSRTFSVGAKRRFDQSSISQNNFTPLGPSSEDETFDKPQKRMRLDDREDAESLAEPEVNTVFEYLIRPKDLFVATQQAVEPAASNYKCENRSDSAAPDLPGPSIVSWNKGIQGGLRTSFGARIAQSQKLHHVPSPNQVAQPNAIVGESPDNTEPRRVSARLKARSKLFEKNPPPLAPAIPAIGSVVTSPVAVAGVPTGPRKSIDPPGNRKHSVPAIAQSKTTQVSKSESNGLSAKEIKRLKKLDVLHAKHVARTLKAGRIYKAETAEGLIEFRIPAIWSPGQKRKTLTKINFIGWFIPRFMTVNVENVHSMTPDIMVGAYGAFLHYEYSDVPESIVEEWIETQTRGSKEGWFREAIQRWTGNTKIDQKTSPGFGSIEASTPENSQKDHSSTSGAESTSLSTSRAESPSGNLVTKSSLACKAVPSPLSGLGAEDGLSISTIDCLNHRADRGDQESLLRAGPNSSQKVKNAEQGSVHTLQQKHLSEYDATPTVVQIAEDGVHIEGRSVAETAVEHDAAEIALILRYYPSSPQHPFVPRCLICAETGHMSSQCPILKCSFCGVINMHFATGCPEAQRCTKCRQHGHSKEGCPEKLKAVSGGPPCVLCRSTDHFENDCDSLWRSFKPREVPKFKVQTIVISCYFCGSSVHYGADCGLHRDKIHPVDYTWSTANAERYIEPQSILRATFAGKDYTIQSKKGFSIKGKANDPTNMNSDENRDAPFLGRPVVRQSRPEPKGRQQIRFNHPGSDPVSQPLRAPITLGPTSQGIRNDLNESYLPQSKQLYHQPYQPINDSARYGRETTFSPPPQNLPYEGSYQRPLPPGPPPSLHANYSHYEPPQTPSSYHAVPPPRVELPSRGRGRKKKKNGKTGSASVVPNPPGSVGADRGSFSSVDPMRRSPPQEGKKSRHVGRRRPQRGNRGGGA